MVRPIEITDTISKVQAVERFQQNVKAATEAVQQFQKELNEKIAGDQVHLATPTPQTDRLILHADERDRDRRRTAEDHEKVEGPATKDADKEYDEGRDENPPYPAGHIDIKV